MKLPLAYYGDPILRKKCDPVKEIDADLLQLIENMKETFRALPAQGLAAPQVKVSIRLFLASFPVPSKTDPDEWENGPILVFINPKISELSKEVWVSEEGCLSIPKLYVPVERPYSLTLEYMNEKGEHYKARLEGLPARVVLHENDHLNGVLHIDRLKGKKRQEIEPKLREIKNRYCIKE